MNRFIQEQNNSIEGDCLFLHSDKESSPKSLQNPTIKVIIPWIMRTKLYIVCKYMAINFKKILK